MEARRRAPRRDGRRTTLRVPDTLMETARELAAELGTTPNDAVVRLAEEGSEARARRRAVEELARRRRAAVMGDGDPADFSGLPSPEALEAAMLSGRREP